MNESPAVEQPPATPADGFAPGRVHRQQPFTMGPAPLPAGSVERARESAALQRFLAHMPVHSQGLENSCGTTALAMGMAYLGVPADFAIIDRAARIFDPDDGIGAGPGELVRFARRAGLQAQHYNEASFAQIEEHVRAGRPVMVLLNYTQGEGDDGMAHYVNVIGFRRDAAGRCTHVMIQNPHGQREKLAYDDFMRQWSDARLLRAGAGALLPTYNRTMIVLDRPEAPPLAGDAPIGYLHGAATTTLMTGVTSWSAAVSSIQRGEIGAGAAQLSAATVNTVVGGAGYFIGNIIGQNIERGGEQLIEIGLELWRGDLLEKLGAFFLVILGAVLKAIGFVLAMAGALVAEIGRLAVAPLTEQGEDVSRRHETREMLLNEHPSAGVEPTEVVLWRASVATKAAMLRNLLMTVPAEERDQRAALVVLRSCVGRADQLRQLVEEFSGADMLLRHFSGEHAIEAARLLGQPAPDVPPEPAPAATPATATS